MNFLPQKISINILLALLFLFGFVGCRMQNKETKIVEIFSAVRVENDSYVFSKESIFEIDDKHKYSLRQRAVYGEDGIIEKFILYKPEGIIEYNREEITKDRKIIDYSGLPFRQKWNYVDNRLIDDNNNYIEGVNKIDNFLLMREKDQKIFFYKIK